MKVILIVLAALATGTAGKSLCKSSLDGLLGSSGLITHVTGPQDCSNMLTQLKSMMNNPGSLNAIYGQYKDQFEKDSARMHHSIFAKTVLSIAEHNVKYEQGLVSWFEAVNQFTDMTAEERSRFLGDFDTNSTLWDMAPTLTTNEELMAGPDELDWRSEGIVGPVKNQGSCGSCWAFGTISAVESANAKKTGNLIQLSEQELVDCDSSNGGCSGGSFRGALNYIRNNGVTKESEYPYEKAKKSCRSSGKSKPVRVASYGSPRSRDEEQMKDYVYTYGVLGTSAVVGDSWYKYGGGVYEGACGNGGHAMSTVGYGKDGSKPYWIIKNSWGDRWGEKGYMRLKRGENKCTIAERNVVYVVTQ